MSEFLKQSASPKYEKIRCVERITKEPFIALMAILSSSKVFVA